jgi:hypothetical protein
VPSRFKAVQVYDGLLVVLIEVRAEELLARQRTRIKSPAVGVMAGLVIEATAVLLVSAT